MKLRKAINVLKQKHTFATDIVKKVAQEDTEDTIWWKDYQDQMSKAILILEQKSED